MGLLTCTFAERSHPLELALEFQRKMNPTAVEIDETDSFTSSIEKIESALAEGLEREKFQPLHSMKRNAQKYGPQYRLLVRSSNVVDLSGAINRHTLSFTWDDPIPDWLLSKILHFAKAIPAVQIEAEDDAGNPIDVESVTHAFV